MPIKFNCPHCKKEFNVKDHLAGKRAACPACKKMLTVPAPTSSPVNIEEFAAAALAEQPAAAAAPEKEPQSVEFVCAYCETKVQVAAELAGKQTSCPECRRIVKVPLLEKAGPKDWRKVDTRLPAGARRDTEPAPEGAWDARAIGTVSREALLEADAVPQVKPKRTWQQWTKIGGTAAAFLVVVAILTFSYLNYRARTLLQRTLSRALDGIEAPKSQDREATAELFRAAGDYHLSASPPDPQTAKDEFIRSRTAALEIASGNERECILTDLLLSITDLGGTKAEADENKRLNWTKAKVQEELDRTWQGLRVPEARALALVLATRKLAEKGEAMRSRAWPAHFPDQKAELLAVLGLELLRSSKDVEKGKAEAILLAETASQPFAKPQGAKPPAPKPEKKTLPPPALIALWVAAGKFERAQALVAEPPQGKLDAALMTGFAEGWARLGDWVKAEGVMQSIPAAERLGALIAVAAAAVDLETADPAKREHYLDEAFSAALTHPRLQELSPWLLYRLVRAGVRGGKDDKALELAKQIAAPDLRGRAQLDVLRSRLASGRDIADESLLQIVDKSTPAYALALELWARHNARIIADRVLKTVDTWPERDRRFGYIGTVLGLEDAARKP